MISSGKSPKSKINYHANLSIGIDLGPVNNVHNNYAQHKWCEKIGCNFVYCYENINDVLKMISKSSKNKTKIMGLHDRRITTK